VSALGKLIAKPLQAAWQAKCSVVGLSNLAFRLYHDHCQGISDELGDALFELILLQEGEEFAMDDAQISQLLNRISSL